MEIRDPSLKLLGYLELDGPSRESKATSNLVWLFHRLGDTQNLVALLQLPWATQTQDIPFLDCLSHQDLRCCIP